jgi:hypothetical protein
VEEKDSNQIATLLPLIKRLVPSIIASELDEFENIFGDTMYAATVYSWDMTTYVQINKWLDSTMGEKRYVIENNKYCFTQEKDRTLFLLKWTR